MPDIEENLPLILFLLTHLTELLGALSPSLTESYAHVQLATDQDLAILNLF